MVVASVALSAVIGCGSSDRRSTGAGGESNGGDGGSQTSTARSFETPQECYAAFVGAAQEKDYAEMCQCMTDQSQGMMAGSLVLMTAMYKLMGGPPGLPASEKPDPEKVATAIEEIKTVLANHGFGDNAYSDITQQATDFTQKMMLAATEQQSRGAGDKSARFQEMMDAVIAMASPVKDKPRFIQEMLVPLEAIGASESTNPFQQIAGELTNVEISGDTAKATQVNASGREQPISFRKTTDGWRIHLDLETMSPTR